MIGLSSVDLTWGVAVDFCYPPSPNLFAAPLYFMDGCRWEYAFESLIGGRCRAFLAGTCSQKTYNSVDVLGIPGRVIFSKQMVLLCVFFHFVCLWLIMRTTSFTFNAYILHELIYFVRVVGTCY